MPDVSMTSFVLRKSEDFGDKPALIDGSSGRIITYRQLTNSIQQVAAGLAHYGLKKGDVFAIYSPNIPEYAITIHAVAILGGILTTINPLYTVDELAKQLNDTGAKYLIAVEAFLDKAREAIKKSVVKDLFVFGNVEDAIPFSSLFHSKANVPNVEINPCDDIVMLPYSSGTTGLPKGVLLTHKNLVANMCQLDGIKNLRIINEKDTLVAVLPFYHIYGMVVILNYGLYKGSTIVTIPRFEMEQFLQVLQDYSVTIAHLVPPIIRGLAKHPEVDKFDLSKLQRIRSGAAPLGEGLAQMVRDRLGCPVVQGYGLNETSPVTHVSPDKPDKIKLASVGPCVSNTEVRIIDEDNTKNLKFYEKGEICIRGPQVMKGYLNQPEMTEAILDIEGWLHTGDIGYVDEDGYLYIVDRKKELIKYKGYSVAPAELEDILLRHPAIADAAVIPSPDDEAGEVPKAFVVLTKKISPEEIISFVEERVAPQKKIRRIEVIDQIPRTASGKILRRQLVERERAQS